MDFSIVFIVKTYGLVNVSNFINTKSCLEICYLAVITKFFIWGLFVSYIFRVFLYPTFCLSFYV